MPNAMSQPKRMPPGKLWVAGRQAHLPLLYPSPSTSRNGFTGSTPELAILTLGTMKLFKSASNAGRGRAPPTRSNIRGRISGPIPIPDEDFPIRNPGSGVGQEGRPNQLDLEARRDSSAVSTNTAPSAAYEEKTTPLARSGRSHTSTASAYARRRTNQSSTLRYSMLSDGTDAASPSRKKSTFKTAIGKLFRKRNRKPSVPSASESDAQASISEDHRRSDPVAKEQGRPDSETEPKRSTSLPVTELNKALRSHSIGPDDYMAIHSARNSLQSDSAFLRKRAATTSSGPVTSRLRDESADMMGLSPRPASAQGHDQSDEYDPESIGRAVSVDFLAPRRRSRSLSQLQRVSEGYGLVRKRSEEIRYWRASQIPGPLSSDVSVLNHGEPGTTETTELTTDDREETPLMATPEPFNFGSMGNMRITEVASLEDRVAALEVQNQKLEKLVNQLFQVVPGVDKYATDLSHPGPATYAAPGSAAVEMPGHRDGATGADPLSPSYSVSDQSNASFEDEKTFIGSLHPSTREAPRPVSGVTIRGAASLPTLLRDASDQVTPEQYNTLKALLDAERTARHTLDARVTQLTQMVHMMSQTTHRLDTHLPSGVNNSISVFEHDDDDDDDNDGTEPPNANMEDGSDTFKTPMEEQPIHNFDDSSGEEIQDGVDNGSRKRAARTLSLGQLTLGKSKHSQQPNAGVDL
ncbi:hypothetical protein NUW58_g8051 [Xylaria curta]|uniref:Uncharacterized protein n=1 Tax=Xylaria curta TaxID=42375 RepID=A0ACC1NBA0_9PEZI|nr:hypothetical protein NUW58_g8051 [Xylaria curta]